MLEGDARYRTTPDTQKRKDIKKQMLLDAAANVFSKKRIPHTTVKDIVVQAAVSVGTFYFYFKSKEGLFAQLYRSIGQKFNDRTMRVVDVAHLSVLKNDAWVMTATLWMYEKKREIAGTMAAWFERFQLAGAEDSV